MNKFVLLLGGAAALYFAAKGSAKAAASTASGNPLSSTTTPTKGGPVFPAADPNASADVPAGQTIYVTKGGLRFWNYLDANGFDHYVMGIQDAAFITNEASITMNRRTGAKVSNDNDSRPSLDNPLAININLGGLRGLRDLGAPRPGALKLLG